MNGRLQRRTSAPERSSPVHLAVCLFGVLIVLQGCALLDGSESNRPPVAAIHVRLIDRDEGVTAEFDGSASRDPDGTIVAYHWDFGDNSEGEGVTVTHAYASEGTYTATLTVRDDQGATGRNTIVVDASRSSGTIAAGVYWTNAGDGAIQRVDLDGGNVRTVVANLASPKGLALSRSLNAIYWTDWADGTIQRADLNGSNLATLASGLSSPVGLALDEERGWLYWADSGTDQIKRVKLDGSETEVVLRDLSIPMSVTIDAVADKLYWTEWGEGRLRRADLDGANAETLLTGLPSPTGLVQDASSETLYWAELTADRIRQARPDGTGLQVVADEVGLPTALALDPIDRRLYWAESHSGHMMSRDLEVSGSGHPFVPDIGSVAAITVLQRR